MSNLFDTDEMQTGAAFSDCRTWRYALWRIWQWEGHANNVMFIGLNPSTADETSNDLTITKCIGYAKRWGYTGIYMLNLFAFRSTDPMGMIAAGDPIGPGNDEAFGYYRSRVGLVVASWGSVATRYRPRLQWQSRIARACEAIAKPIYCLGKTQDGSPKHPSRLEYDIERELFWTPRQ